MLPKPGLGSGLWHLDSHPPTWARHRSPSDPPMKDLGDLELFKADSPTMRLRWACCVCPGQAGGPLPGTHSTGDLQGHRACSEHRHPCPRAPSSQAPPPLPPGPPPEPSFSLATPSLTGYLSGVRLSCGLPSPSPPCAPLSFQKSPPASPDPHRPRLCPAGHAQWQTDRPGQASALHLPSPQSYPGS